VIRSGRRNRRNERENRGDERKEKGGRRRKRRIGEGNANYQEEKKEGRCVDTRIGEKLGRKLRWRRSFRERTRKKGKWRHRLSKR